MSKIKRFFTEKLLTARGIIMLLAGGLAFYFEEHGITLMQADKGSGEERIDDTMHDIILAVWSSAVMNLLLLGYLSRFWFKRLANYNFVLPSSKEEA